MLEIRGRKNSSNVIPVMWAVGELGLEHRRHNIGGSFGGDDTEEYVRLNPNRLIPTISDDGFVLWESMAITRYLCRHYGLGTLFPSDDQQAALADQWMDWYKSSITPNLMPIFVNLVRTPKPERNEEVIKRCTAATIGYLDLLDRHLQGKSYILGEHFSMGDIPLGAMLQVLQPGHRAAGVAKPRGLVCSPVRASGLPAARDDSFRQFAAGMAGAGKGGRLSARRTAWMLHRRAAA